MCLKSHGSMDTHHHHHHDAEPPSSPSLPLRRRRHHSPIGLTACFRPSAVGDGGDPDHPAVSGPVTSPHLLSPSTWFRSHWCRNLVPCGARHHRRHHSADFRYDPLSYALNFDEGIAEGEPVGAEDLRYRTFSSRLPASPPHPARATADRERAPYGIGPGREASL